MQITLNLPDELVEHIPRDRLPHTILEALLLQAYQNETLTHAQVGNILGLPSRWAVDAFLKRNHADLHYDEEDLASDRAALQQLRQQNL